MTPHLEQPADLVYAPPRYPSPDWEAIGRVARVYVPEDGDVGYAVLQGDTALAWISWVDPDHLGYPIRRHVSKLLRENAVEGITALDTWARILVDTLHAPPVDLFLPALLADLG